MLIRVRQFKNFLALLFLALSTFACDGTFTDPRDGKEYRTTVKIGEQVWMAENLSYNAKGSKCYENDTLYCDKYGRLYDWNTAMVVCPKGWHLTSNAEWLELVNFIGYDRTAGKKLKAESGWNDYKGKSGNGTDDFGFSALPGGFGFPDGSFYDAGSYGYWWSSTEYDANDAYNLVIGYYGEGVSRDGNVKGRLFSVRCLQD